MYFPTLPVSLTLLLLVLLGSAQAWVDCGPYDNRGVFTLTCNIPTEYLALGDVVFVNVSVDPSHSGTFDFTSSDSQNIHGAEFEFPVVNGQGHFSFSFLYAKGNKEQWFVANTDQDLYSEVNIHVVNSDFPDTLVLATNVTTVQVGVPVWVNVTALTGTSPTVGMQRQIFWDSTDSRSILKNAYTTFNQGIGSNYITFLQLGTQSFSANVTYNGTTTISTNTLHVTVTPGAPYNFINASYPDNIKVGVQTTFTFAVVDMGGNPVTSFYQGINATSFDTEMQVGSCTEQIDGGVIFVTVPITFFRLGTETITFVSAGMQNAVLTMVQVNPGYLASLTANLIDTSVAAGAELDIYIGGKDLRGNDVDYVADVVTVSLPGSKDMKYYNVTPNQIRFYAQTAGVNLPLKVLAQSAGIADVVAYRNLTVFSGQPAKVFMSQISPVVLNKGAVVPINVSLFDGYANLVNSDYYDQVTINMSVNGQSHFAYIYLTNGRGAKNITFDYAGNLTVSAYISSEVVSAPQQITVLGTNGISTGGSDSCDIDTEENCALGAAQCTATNVQQACACYANIMTCFVKANCIDGSFYGPIYSSCLQICPQSTCNAIQSSTTSTTKGGSTKGSSGDGVNSSPVLQPVLFVFMLVLLSLSVL